MRIIKRIPLLGIIFEIRSIGTPSPSPDSTTRTRPSTIRATTGRIVGVRRGTHEDGTENGQAGADDAEGGLDVRPVAEGGLVVCRVGSVLWEGGHELDEDDEADEGG